MDAILGCSESWDCNEDKNDKTKCFVVMYEPLLWEYDTRSPTAAGQLSRLLSKYSTELGSGFRFPRSLPQICAEVSGAANFDHSVSQIL